MKVTAFLLVFAASLSAAAQSSMSMPISASPIDTPIPGERLGTVSFSVSCAPAVQPAFSRGVALLHDFWYEEARPQFERVAQGIAMSSFHQIWDRPDPTIMKLGWDEVRKAQAAPPGTAREQEYIAALAAFFKPGPQDFPSRIAAYSSAMGALYAHYPHDVDAGAFYALSLLAARPVAETTQTQQRKAMAVLVPLYRAHPDNPGVVHYVIHSCDNPAMAKDGLAAAQHYGEIAQSGPHAVHMSGHIFARLGMWPEDIASQAVSIKASENAEAHHMSGIMDEPHSYDFMMYADLQSGQDAAAKQILDTVPSVLDRLNAMPGMGNSYMGGMVYYYRLKFPVFYSLELSDWQTAAALQSPAGTLPEDEAMVWWARSVADGHLHHATEAQHDLARFDALMAETRKGAHSFLADSTATKIWRSEIAAWGSYAADHQDDALRQMRAAADLQDKVGQAEVDIPAREMLGDMLLDLHQPQLALAEYRVALQLSPNRFNGLYHAGMAAEAAGDKAAAGGYFTALLKSTSNGGHSSRPELAYAKKYVSSAQLAKQSAE
jgi:tetratricopeptide (TPR) repeat protein